jgi:hypothetical protein
MPEDGNIHNHCCENLKSYWVGFIYTLLDCRLVDSTSNPMFAAWLARWKISLFHLMFQQEAVM